MKCTGYRGLTVVQSLTDDRLHHFDWRSYSFAFQLGRQQAYERVERMAEVENECSIECGVDLRKLSHTS